MALEANGNQWVGGQLRTGERLVIGADEIAATSACHDVRNAMYSAAMLRAKNGNESLSMRSIAGRLDAIEVKFAVDHSDRRRRARA